MRTDLSNNLASILDVFTAMEDLVARLYRWSPKEETIQYFKDLNEHLDEEDLFLQDEQCSEGISLICKFCSDHEIKDALRLATADHSRLFVGPTHLLSPPWSSVYLDTGGLFGPTSLKVEEKFKSFGFQIPEGNHEPYDHIAYELEFIAEMNKKAAAALCRGEGEEALKFIEEEKHFMDTYLFPWLDQFIRLIQENARTDFYRGLAILSLGLARMQSELAEKIVDLLQNTDN